MPLHLETPLLESRPLSARAGREIWLKLEAVQPSGSFKIRGIGHACETYVRCGAQRFISSSGGNAGIAVAYAGRRLGVPVVVVVPETATERAQALIRNEGGAVIVHGASWQEANALAVSMVGASDAFLHPFDDPLLWEGHATLVDEVARAGVKPDAIVLSVGGGGLLCGVVEGLRRNGWSDVPVLAVETTGADSLARSLQAAQRVELPRIASIATSLGARQISARAFEVATTHRLSSVVVSDAAAVRACLQFLDDQRLLVEPACGASLALAYDAANELQTLQRVLLVVCGGVTATLEQLQQWAQQFAATGRL
jgi:L-serine/L-threonine ammonia-lyase